MFSARVFRRSLPLAKSPKGKPCEAVEATSPFHLSRLAAARSTHHRAEVAASCGALNRLDTTAIPTEYVAVQVPEDAPAFLVDLWNFPRSATSTAPKPNQAAVEHALRRVDGRRHSRPAVAVAAIRRGLQAGWCVRSGIQVAANRCFSSSAKSNGDDEGDRSEGKAGPKGAQSAEEVVTKDRRETFARARHAGITRRLLEGGGVPLHSSNIDPEAAKRGRFAPVWNEEGEEEEDGETNVGDDGALADSAIASLASDEDVLRASSGTDAQAAERKTHGTEEGGLGDSDAGGSADAMGRKAASLNGGSSEGSQEHPVLGQLVADLKYKRVYLTSAEALAKAPVWQRESTLRPVHAVEIAEAKYFKKDVVEGMPGVITLFKRPLLPLTKEKQAYTLGIVDGQHRLSALLVLADEGLWDRSERNIVAEVFNTKDEDEVATLFAEINKAEPTPLTDMSQGEADEIKDTVTKACFHLHKLFPEAFGSVRAHPPCVHLATFQETIIRSGMIERHKLYDSQLLLDYLLRVNEIISHREPARWAEMVGKEEGQYATKKALTTALRRAKRFKFYLGLDWSWTLV